MTREEYLALRERFPGAPKNRRIAPTRQRPRHNPRRAEMARAAKKDEGEGAGISGEYKRPDAAGALKIYRDEIAPKNAHMATIKGDLSDPYKRIKDTCHFPRKVLDFLMQLEDMEEAKRDHWLLAFYSGLKELDLHLPSDLVTMAEGKDGGSVIPIGERKRPQLATLAGDPNLPMGVPSDGSEDDLARAGEDDEFEEASEEELAAQADRPGHEFPEAAE